VAGSPDQAASGSDLRTARKILLGALTIEFVVLVATGLFLVLEYRPEVSQSWSDVGRLSSGTHLWTFARLLHRTASGLFLATAIATAVVVALGSRASLSSDGPRRRRIDPLLGIGLVPLALFGSFTGYLLPWDQLALWAVTVGTNMRGYRPLFDHQVKFVLIGGVEVGRDTLVRWFYAHLLVGGPLIGAFIVAAWWPMRRASRQSAPVATAAAVEGARKQT
jgi:quinol-cytochrome oxidoreductase complex cytochrome b subunit